MEEVKSIREVLKEFEEGVLNIPGLFYSYACNERELKDRGTRLLKYLKEISRSPHLNIVELGVAFYNIQPLNGFNKPDKNKEMYDGMTIFHIASDNDIYRLTPKRKINDVIKPELSGRHSKEFKVDKWEDVLEYFYNADKFEY